MLENRDEFSKIKNLILNLRKETTSANLEAVLQHFSFEVFLVTTKNVLYLKSLSLT